MKNNGILFYRVKTNYLFNARILINIHKSIITCGIKYIEAHKYIYNKQTNNDDDRLQPL